MWASRLRIARRNVVGLRGVQTSCEELSKKYLVPTYNTDGIRTLEGLEFVEGSGCYLFDSSKRPYLDFGAGIAVTALGHGDEALAEVVGSQMRVLSHTSNVYHSRPPLDLAKRLVELSTFDKVFFCNSGTEANEAALKFARRYFGPDDTQTKFACHDPSARANMCQTKGGSCLCFDLPTSRTKVVAFEQSFHGRSMGALSATHKPKIRAPFAPLIQDTQFVRYNDLDALKAVMDEDVAAIIVEPVQGEGGVTPARPGFLKGAASLAKECGALLIVDEVQSGVGRTGTLWAHEKYGIEPDIMTVAKPLANGLPIGVTLVRDHVAERIHPGDHGTTFGGNPLVTSAALHVLNRIAAPEFLRDVQEKGALLHDALQKLAKSYPTHIKTVRSSPEGGLFAGIQLNGQSAPIIKAAAKQGLLILGAGDKGDVIRIAPPLIITPTELQAGMSTLEKVFASI